MTVYLQARISVDVSAYAVPHHNQPTRMLPLQVGEYQGAYKVKLSHWVQVVACHDSTSFCVVDFARLFADH